MAGGAQWDSNDQEELETAVAQAINAAIEEEREAILKMATNCLRRYDVFEDPDAGVWISFIDAVRARSAASNHQPTLCANCGHKKMAHFWGSVEGCKRCECPGFVAPTASTHSIAPAER